MFTIGVFILVNSVQRVHVQTMEYNHSPDRVRVSLIIFDIIKFSINYICTSVKNA